MDEPDPVEAEFESHLEEAVRLSDAVESGAPAFVTFGNGEWSWAVDVTRVVQAYDGTEYLVVIARQE